VVRDDEAVLSEAILKLATEYGRYGDRRVTELLRAAGWRVNVQRIWRREGLKVPTKQPKRGRLWLNDASCRPLRHSTQITCGPTISSPTGLTMGDQLEC
jgi:putative transposase